MSLAPANYAQVISDLKEKIRLARQKVSLTVNKELLQVFWEMGSIILQQQKEAGWGSKIIDRLAADLKTEFPDFRGLSVRNLKYMRAFANAYPQFGQQAAAQIQATENQSVTFVQQAAAQLPWGHHQVLLDKVKEPEQRLFYIQKAVENGWSRNVMVHQLETNLYERTGKAITNFKNTLPAVHSDLAQQTIKNPYVFDFLSFGEEIKERELEKALIQHLKKFMLELGKGFAYVGNQKNLVVDGDDFFLDLLFYNYHLHCFVNFELKIGDFKPEFAGKLNFYVNTINEKLKGAEDKPTIGVLLCKTPNETVVKYSLQGIDSPIGVAGYEFAKALPAELKGEMPTVEELEQEIEQGYEELKNPSDKKMDRLKELLKDLKQPEVKEKKNKENTKRVFERLVPVLAAKMLNSLNKIKEDFQSIEISFTIDSHSFHSYEDAERNFSEISKSYAYLFRIEAACKGLKKAGTKAFDCWNGFQIDLRDYGYNISLTREPGKIILDKLYHELPTDEEEDQIIEKWFDYLLDDITQQLERITSKNMNNA